MRQLYASPLLLFSPIPLPLPPFFFFFCSRSNARAITRLHGNACYAGYLSLQNRNYFFGRYCTTREAPAIFGYFWLFSGVNLNDINDPSKEKSCATKDDSCLSEDCCYAFHFSTSFPRRETWDRGCSLPHLAFLTIDVNCKVSRSKTVSVRLGSSNVGSL